MILTGNEINRMIERQRIVIDPFYPEYIDPNSYSFHLGDQIVEYEERIIDSAKELSHCSKVISESGFLLLPDRFYLGHTYERIGGLDFASELYANLSTALSGIFIQTSAPLGHTGAVINWTLEIVVAQPVLVFPKMKIGKICFWKNFGSHVYYDGRYKGSASVVPSRIRMDSQ